MGKLFGTSTKSSEFSGLLDALLLFVPSPMLSYVVVAMSSSSAANRIRRLSNFAISSLDRFPIAFRSRWSNHQNKCQITFLLSFECSSRPRECFGQAKHKTQKSETAKLFRFLFRRRFRRERIIFAREIIYKRALSGREEKCKKKRQRMCRWTLKGFVRRWCRRWCDNSVAVKSQLTWHFRRTDTLHKPHKNIVVTSSSTHDANRSFRSFSFCRCCRFVNTQQKRI